MRRDLLVGFMGGVSVAFIGQFAVFHILHATGVIESELAWGVIQSVATTVLFVIFIAICCTPPTRDETGP